MAACYDRVTKNDALGLKEKLDDVKSRFMVKDVKIVGSVDKRGWSDNDLDMKVLCEKGTDKKVIVEFFQRYKVPEREVNTIQMFEDVGCKWINENDFYFGGTTPVFEYYIDDRVIKVDIVLITTSDADFKDECWVD